MLLRSAARGAIELKERYTHHGFRVVRAIYPEALVSTLRSSSATDTSQ